jgi:hypothetical protein
MEPIREQELIMTRRQLFGRTSKGIGVMALASLLNPELFAAEARDPKTGGLVGLPHFAPKAKRVIFLHQSGAPSQIDLFDYKPKLAELAGTELPDSVRKGQRITGMTSKTEDLIKMAANHKLTNLIHERIVKAARQDDASLYIDFEDGSTLTVKTAEPASSVMLRDSQNKLEYAD